MRVYKLVTTPHMFVDDTIVSDRSKSIYFADKIIFIYLFFKLEHRRVLTGLLTFAIASVQLINSWKCQSYLVVVEKRFAGL